jgi:hypothetical protein
MFAMIIDIALVVLLSYDIYLHLKSSAVDNAATSFLDNAIQTIQAAEADAATVIQKITAHKAS